MCITPLTIRLKHQNMSVSVPCGKCLKCYKRRVSGWSFRLMQEDKRALSSVFLTLTYDTRHVTITRNGFMSLNKRDIQLFMKRLRKVNPEPLKYYVCGEYGSKTKRPHYHMILFNAKIETIQAAWSLGDIHYGTVSGASVGYTLKYMCKTAKIPMHKNDDRVPEFALMSKGLGDNYVTEASVKWHLADKENRMYVNLEGGKKAGMPRYYKNRIYTEYERKLIGVKTRIAMEKREAAQPEKTNLEKYNKVQSDANTFRKLKTDESKRGN